MLYLKLNFTFLEFILETNRDILIRKSVIMGEEMKKYKTFEEMYLDTYKLIFQFIFDYIKEWSIAEDISSIVWGKVSENPEQYLQKSIEHLHNYMRVMVRNEIKEYYRRAERQNKAFEKTAACLSPLRTTEEEYIQREKLNELARARRLLSEEENLLLDLRFDKELSVKETGKAMGLSISAVKMRQSRALLKLKKFIG